MAKLNPHVMSHFEYKVVNAYRHLPMLFLAGMTSYVTTIF